MEIVEKLNEASYTVEDVKETKLQKIVKRLPIIGATVAVVGIGTVLAIKKL